MAGVYAFFTGKRKLTGYRLPLFFLLFACFATAILGDSAAEALLLAHFDAAVVARMYLINALLLFATSIFVLPIIDRIDRGAFFLWMTIVHGVFLFIVWAVIAMGVHFLFAPLFSYAYVSKILLFLMFWTLANDLTDSRKAGCDFPFIASGGTLGAIAVSFSIPALLRIVSAQTLLPVWATLALGLGIFFVPIRHSFSRQFKPAGDKTRQRGGLRRIPADLALVKQEPLLRLMAVLYFLLFVVVLGQQYGFYSVVKSRLQEAERIASFLGVFTGLGMGATFVLQSTVAGRVLRRFGSTRSMFIAPAALLIVFTGSAVASAVPGLGPSAVFWIVVTGVGLRIAVFDSFFSPNFQVFFSSLPHQIRGRGKLTLEGVVKPAAIACASVLLMTVVPRMPFGAVMLAYGGMCAAMLVVTWRLRPVYTSSLTRYLGGFHANHGGILRLADISDKENMYESIAALLESEPFDTKSYLIDMLAQINTRESTMLLRQHIAADDAKVRSRIVSALTPFAREDCLPVFRSLLADPDHRVVANTIFALAAYNDSRINKGLGAFIHHPCARVRANTVVALWNDPRRNKGAALAGPLREMLRTDDPELWASALFAVEKIDSQRAALLLLKPFFAEKKNSLVQNYRVWKWFLRAAASTGSDSALSMCMYFADLPSCRKRHELENAIAALPGRGLGQDALINRAADAPFVHRNLMLKGLFLLRRRCTGLLLTEDQRKKLLAVASREYRRFLEEARVVAGLERAPAHAGVDLLIHAYTEEHCRVRLDTLLSIAALFDESGEIAMTARRLFHPDRHIRARALEVLDNAGNGKINRLVIDSLEVIANGVVEAEQTASACDPIARAARSDNAWVRRCAEYAARAGDRQARTIAGETAEVD